MNLQRQPPPQLPDIQLPGGGRPNNLPQNDGADDTTTMTTEVSTSKKLGI